jgi:ABC-type nitrate/sulfonate/bicarbonate transport system ATPase subunit
MLLSRPGGGQERGVAGDAPAERNGAVVFQQNSLAPHMTVRDNLDFPMRALRTPGPRWRGRSAMWRVPSGWRTSSTTGPPRFRAA